MPSPTAFVLGTHRNVQVNLAGSSVQDLTKDELEEWPPFKVRPAGRALLSKDRDVPPLPCALPC